MPSSDLTVTVDLLHRAQAGDGQAFNRILRRYLPRVRQVVRVRLPRHLCARLDEDDVLQEAFLQAVRDFSDFEMREESSLVNWLATLVQRRAIDAAEHHSRQKRDARREVRLETEDGQVVHELPTQDPLPPDEAVRQEDLARMEDCLRQMPAEQREIIVWRELLEASWEEVARQNGLASVGAARHAHSVAFERLSRLMNGQGQRPPPSGRGISTSE